NADVQPVAGNAVLPEADFAGDGHVALQQSGRVTGNDQPRGQPAGKGAGARRGCGQRNGDGETLIARSKVEVDFKRGNYASFYIFRKKRIRREGERRARGAEQTGPGHAIAPR